MKHRIWIKVLLLIFVVSLSLLIVLPADASAGGGHVTYVVRPGDRLASIARQYCTNWQTIYYLNRNVIGPNPDYLVPGTALVVPNECGAPGGCYGVYDRGWMKHAQGPVYGNYYSVIYGDTWYSISKRFGVPIPTLQYANGMGNLYANTTITVPCLGYVPPTPPPQPPTPTPPIQESFINITSPPSGAVLPPTFTVSGTGGNLFEANVVVRAIDQNNVILAEKATSLQGPDVGTGGQGTWTVQLTVNAPQGTSGKIQASSPGSNAFSSVPVFFGQGQSGDVVYPPGQCQIQVQANAPLYDQPEGNQIAQFTSAVSIEAQERRLVNSVDWYRVTVVIDSQTKTPWVSSSNLASIGAGCY